jgi:hypothetical protein
LEYCGSAMPQLDFKLKEITMQFKQKPIVALVSLALALSAGTANALLERMGPVNNAPSVGGFPSWFMDKTGLAIEFCDPLNAAELNGGWCTLLPPNPPSAPETFPGNFFVEHFYHDARNTTSFTHANGNSKVVLTIAVEAAFVNGATVVPGQQMTFGRNRISITNLPATGVYKVFTPYSEWALDGNTGGKIFYTEDVGIGCPTTFECTLGTAIGPFLLPSATIGGGEVPPIPDLLAGQDPFYDALAPKSPYPATGKKYITDPKRIGPVTGSPLPAFTGSDGVVRNHNTLYIEAPDGTILVDSPQNWVLTGRILTGTIAGAVTVDRANYATNGVAADGTAPSNKVDVFARAFGTKPARLPAAPIAAPIVPILGYYDAPCTGALTVDPLTGIATVNPPPYTAPVGFAKNQMFPAGSNVWGQSSPQPTATNLSGIPSYACVEDDTARDALGNVIPAYFLKKVTDALAVSVAFYNGPGGGTLAVNAASSDTTPLTATTAPPVLTLDGFGPGGTGLDLVAGAASVPGLLAPPSKVQVTSSQGGVTILDTTTAVGAPVILGVPLASADTVTMFEDCSPLPAAACAVPQVINPLANDTINGGAIAAGTGTITITQGSTKGTAVVDNVAGTITYTPNPNVNGTDAIAYTVTVAGQVSNPVNITINITPVNDAPVAVNDSTGAVRGVVNTFNVLTNDTDPDGSLVPTGRAVIATGNANLGITAGASYAGGVVSYTPPPNTAAGTYSFTYNAVDAGGVPSANAATVTVVVSTAEGISPQPPAVFTAKTGRWVARGTVAPDGGQTMTVAYADGNRRSAAGACPGINTAGTVLGTVVEIAGAWLFDQILPLAGITNPSNAGNTPTNFWCTSPSNLRISSSLTNATAPMAISVK